MGKNQELTAKAFLNALLNGETNYDKSLFYALANAMEIYADAKVEERLALLDVVGRSEQLPCDCVIGFEGDTPITFELCENCKAKI